MRRPPHRPSPRPTAAPSELPRELAEEIRRSSHPARAAEAVAHAEKAIAALRKGDAHRAVSEAGRAKRLATRSPAVREILAMAHYDAGSYREALREMQAYRRMSGRLDQNHVIADCYRALGKPDRAAEEAEQALGAPVPEEVRAEAALVGASALADLGRYDQALALIRRFPTKATVARPFDLRVWYVTGDILERAGRRDEAAREFLKVLRHDQSAFDAADRLARLR